MSRTTFRDYQEPTINAAWLNEVDRCIFSDQPGTLRDELEAPLASMQLGYVAQALAAIPTTLGERLHWLAVHPEDFGAVDSWDGISTLVDDTAACQAAFDTGLPVLLRRRYRCTDTLHSPGQLIEGAGYQTGFVFDSTVGKNGIEILPTSAHRTAYCYNFAIFKRGADGGIAIKTPYQAAQYTQYRSAFQYEKLLIAGYTFPAPGTNNAFETLETWLCGIEQGDAWSVGLRKVDCYGSYRSDTDHTNQVKSVFIRLQAESAMLTAHLGQWTCSNVYRGVELGDRCFFQISGFDIAHACDGIYQIGGNATFAGDNVTTAFAIPLDKYGATTPNPPPVGSVRVLLDGTLQKLDTAYTYDVGTGVVTFLVAPATGAQIRFVIGMAFGESKVLHGNINSQRYGIYFQDIGTRELTGVVIRRHKFGWKGATYTWAGIRLVNCTYIWLTNCQIQPDAITGDWPTSPQHAVQLIKCGGVTAVGTVIGANIDYGFNVSNTTMFNVEATQTFQSGATNTLFYLSENTRQSRIGSYTKVRTFQGIDYATDGTIAMDAVQFDAVNMVPVSSTPRYVYRRPTSAVDEKLWRTASGATTWSLQLTNDLETTNVNALIVTRTGMAVTSFDFRGELLTTIVKPAADNSRTLGTATNRWSTVYAGTGTINTSDERDKQQILPINAAALRAWGLVQYVQYKFNDSVEEKGEGARWHFGLIAQRVKEAFESQGLNAFEYGLLCYDEWAATPATFDEDGTETSPARPAGNRYGVRYEEALALEAAYLRSRLEAFNA